METRTQRRVRRDQRHRIVTVAGACALALGVALVLASCARPEHTTAGPLLEVRTVRARKAHHRATSHAVPAPPTTTTTTRPAVNPELGPPPPNTGEGRRIVYCNSCQRVWLVDETNYLVATFPVSGRRSTPRPGTYHVFRKLESGYSKAHNLRLPYFVGFAWGSTTDIGFHGIPLRSDGSPIESDAQLGQPLSSGCVRLNQMVAKAVYEWTPEGTTVVVTP
jgi:lipoprotein-anchoring transpeptidase ErfK/SrfK